MIFPSICIVIGIYFLYHTPWRVRICCPGSDVNKETSLWRKEAGLKLYLIVKISSDIVTEKHCCQVCVLSMMFFGSNCRLCADMHVESPQAPMCWQPASGPGEVNVVENFFEYQMVWHYSDKPTWEMIWKNILYIWFSQFTLTETYLC